MNKAQEKEILRAGINLMVSQAGPHSYLAGIFTPETVSAIEKDIDNDIFYDFGNAREAAEVYQKELDRVNGAILAGQKNLEEKEREFRALSARMNAVKAEIRELARKI